MINFKEKATLIWEVADLLRGDYRQSDYGKGHFANDSITSSGLRIGSE